MRVSVKAKLITAILTACILISGCSNTTSVAQKESNAGRFRCEYGQVYLITDTKTGVQYLVWDEYYKGGVCVLVDRDGKPLLAGDAE